MSRQPSESSRQADASDADETAEPTPLPVPVPVLTEPRDGVGALIDTPGALTEAVAALSAGSGPVAVDAERAHGFRYTQRAYLIQLRRAGVGTLLVDPVALAGSQQFAALGDSLREPEWILHAANQDLACLYQAGLAPTSLFDTELAGRLLGYPRVALGTMVEELFSVRLLKEHSAADWSTRPLPLDWLRYAALDVELLIDLREELARQLYEAGKTEWARQEFAALVQTAGGPPENRPDPWRRTSGIHRVRTRRGLAVVRELWQARDRIARDTDRAPGKVLPDLAISDLAALPAPTRSAFRSLPSFARRNARRYESVWADALDRALALPESSLPPVSLPTDGPPQPRLWASRDPVAAERLARAREALTALGEQLDVPVENLLTPDHVRRLCWRPPPEPTEAAVDAALEAAGARPWQRELTVPLLTPLL